MTENINSVDQPLVSVVIPTYNRSKELQRAIKSVLNQTYQNFEILVVDDGSEEDLKIVCDSFNDERIRFLRNEKHTNANVARNRGIKEAKGEYIAMLDSDDEYLPIHLERRIEKIKEWGCDGIFGSAYVFDGETQKIRLSRPLNDKELMINYLLSDGFAPTPSHFYKTKAAKKIMWDESLLRHQDFDFSIRFSERYNFKGDYEPTILINWILAEKRNIDFHSCMSFISKIKNKISNDKLINYYKFMFTQAQTNNNKKATQFYKKQLANLINYISLEDWYSLHKNKNNKSMMVLYLFTYFYRNIVTLLKKQLNIIPRQNRTIV